MYSRTDTAVTAVIEEGSSASDLIWITVEFGLHLLWTTLNDSFCKNPGTDE